MLTESLPECYSDDEYIKPLDSREPTHPSWLISYEQSILSQSAFPESEVLCSIEESSFDPSDLNNEIKSKVYARNNLNAP